MSGMKKRGLFFALPLYLAGLLLLSGIMPTAATAEPAFSHNIDSLLLKAQQDGSVRVIVGVKVPSFQPEGKLQSPVAVTAQRSAISSAQQRLLGRLTGSQKSAVKRFATIPFVSLEVNAGGMATLLSDPEVTSIKEDQLARASLGESTPLVRAPEAWSAGSSGSGQTVAVLDTGVDRNHPLLSGKVVSEACYSTTDAGYSASSMCPGGVASSTAAGSAMPYGGNCPAGECDHGTHVAGIAAGAASGVYTYNGVAKDADIIAVQVFSRFDSDTHCGGAEYNPCALSFESDQILGLERVYALRSTYDIAAVNISLGDEKYTSQSGCDSAYAATKAAIDNLRSAGIATVVASGNNGYTDGTNAPGCISSAVSVGSSGDGSSGATVDVVSSFSNSASFLNLLAPGQWITAPIPGNSSGTWCGTSMATSQVAGAWAVLRSAAPAATVDEILAALTSTGISVTDARNSLTKPRIRVKEAMDALASGITTTTADSTTTTTAAVNLLQDPSFELYSPNPYWTEASTNFGTPLCTTGGCGDGGGTAGPRTGSVWSWFGGTESDETGSVLQEVIIPSGANNLEFYLWIGSAGDGSDAGDCFTASIDGDTVFTTNATEISSYPAYTLVSVDISAYADNETHTVAFLSQTTGQVVNFNLDDVTLLEPTTSTTTSVAPMTTTTTVEPTTTTVAPVTTTTTAPVCTDADADGYFVGEGCTPQDCDDTDAFYNEICPDCEVRLMPRFVNWLLPDKEKTRRLLVIGKRGTVFDENTPVVWETDGITVVSKRAFLKRFMFMRVSIDGAALDKGAYRALIGTCAATVTLAR